MTGAVQNTAVQGSDDPPSPKLYGPFPSFGRLRSTTRRKPCRSKPPVQCENRMSVETRSSFSHLNAYPVAMPPR